MCDCRSTYSWGMLLGAGLLLASSVGCQADYNGQTLPSPYWHLDDVQYFPPGSEFKLAREAAALKAAKRDVINGRRNGAAGVAPVAPAPGPAPVGAPDGAQPLVPPMGDAPAGAAPAAPPPAGNNPFGAPQ